MSVYNQFKAQIMNKVIDMEADTIKCALMNNSHSFDATDDDWSDVSVNEITGTGYTVGGQALSGKTVTVDNVGNRGVFDANNVTWTTATITAFHAVIYNDSTTPKYLIASISLGGEQQTTGGDFIIEWDSTDGIATIT